MKTSLARIRSASAETFLSGLVNSRAWPKYGSGSPERAAEWSIKTGYVAVSPAAYKTPAMETYAKGFPAATVARDQLEYAVPELSVHENGRIYKFVNDAVQSAVTGAQKPQEALAAAQSQADRVLKAYK